MDVKAACSFSVNWANKMDRAGMVKIASGADEMLNTLCKYAEADFKLEGVREGIGAALKLLSAAGDDLYQIKEVMEYLQDLYESMPQSQSAEVVKVPETKDDFDALMCFDV